jgi:hypothetical protein
MQTGTKESGAKKMADVISLDDKLGLAKNKKAALLRRRKVLAVQKVLQCTQCVFKCEKCGIQISHNYQTGEKNIKNYKVPYRLCDSCSEEYTDYINKHQGEGDHDSYWHNESWIDLWKKWIDYQGAIDSYLKSKEFLQLLQELKQARPDE